MLTVYNLDDDTSYQYMHNDYSMALIVSYASDNNLLSQIHDKQFISDISKHIKKGLFGFHLYSYSVKFNK